ncbi:MAG: phosphoenolpyruvate carboxykinase (ATP), partial [Chloroflexota bacterium]
MEQQARLFLSQLNRIIADHPNANVNPTRSTIINWAVEDREAIVSAYGALVTWTPTESTGRSPKDTYIVRRPLSENEIDWDSPNNIPMAPDTFDMIVTDMLELF